MGSCITAISISQILNKLLVIAVTASPSYRIMINISFHTDVSLSTAQ